MNDNKGTKSFDSKVRLFIYDHFIKLGQAPSILETARALTKSTSEVKAAYQRLAEGRALVLQTGDGEVLMAEPFSAVPTTFKVKIGDHSWWGNCIWDAMGIPAMLHKDAQIITACGDCSDSMVLTIKDNSLLETSGIVHFLVPPRNWWDNVVFA